MSFLSVMLVVLAYLMGSVSAAIICCRLMGLPDPRSQGSKNPGATNVMRFGGKKAAAITLVGDVCKGLLPILIARLVGAGSVTIALCALAAFLGHLYPVFFGFKGGKGVATALGCMLGLNLIVAACVCAVWLLVFFITRLSSMAALTAAVSSPMWLMLFKLPYAYVCAVLVMVGLLVWRHRSNIQRLISGEESGFKSKP